MSPRVETIGDCTLILGDCLEVLPTLGPVDACLTDPPYGIGESNERNLTRGKSSAKWKREKPRDYGSFDWDRRPAPPESILAMRDMSRWQIIFGGNYFALPPTPCWLIWDKLNSGDFADCEMAWTNLPKAVRRIQWRWNGFIRAGNEERFHPTQKPVEVMKWCIGHYPDTVDTILDPFMGSATTGVACVRLGRPFIGIEIHEPYFDVACRRIEEAHRQADLFVPAPATTPAEQTTLFDDAPGVGAGAG